MEKLAPLVQEMRVKNIRKLIFHLIITLIIILILTHWLKSIYDIRKVILFFLLYYWNEMYAEYCCSLKHGMKTSKFLGDNSSYHIITAGIRTSNLPHSMTKGMKVPASNPWSHRDDTLFDNCWLVFWAVFPGCRLFSTT